MLPRRPRRQVPPARRGRPKDRMLSAVLWFRAHLLRSRAHSSVVEHSPYKRGVTGSNPVAPTRSEGIWGSWRRRGAKRGAKELPWLLWRTLRSGAAGMAKMPSTSRRTRTGTSARSRSASARTGSACAGRSPGRPSRRSGTSSGAARGARRRVAVVGGYTVRAAVDDWLEHGLSGRSARTVQLYRDGVRPLTDRLGARPLRKLSAADVRSALAGLSDSCRRGRCRSRKLPGAGIRQPRPTTGGPKRGGSCPAARWSEGRPSKALSVEQAQRLLRAA